jgi:hypothetical protein
MSNRKKDLLFSKIIAFGYEDGPTNGVVQSADGATAYRFELLATDIDGAYDYEAWDRGEELRVYSLTMLLAGTFERIVGILSLIEKPNWPIWTPGMVHRSPTFDALFMREVDPLLHVTVGRRFVVIVHSLLAPPVEIHQLHGQKGPDNWFTLLGPESTKFAS